MSYNAPLRSLSYILLKCVNTRGTEPLRDTTEEKEQQKVLCYAIV